MTSRFGQVFVYRDRNYLLPTLYQVNRARKGDPSRDGVRGSAIPSGQPAAPAARPVIRSVFHATCS